MTGRPTSWCAEHSRYEYVPPDLDPATDPHEPGPALVPAPPPTQGYTLTLEAHQLPADGPQDRRHTMAADCWCKPTVTVVHHGSAPRPPRTDPLQLVATGK